MAIDALSALQLLFDRTGLSTDSIRTIKSFSLSLVATIVTAYLGTFLLLAILRVLTGISIQRIGYFSLHHVSFSFQSHVVMSLDKIGFKIHRPTFTCPGWITLYMINLKVQVDPAFFSRERKPKSSTPQPIIENENDEWHLVSPNSTLFYVLQFLLNYIQYIDFNALNSTFAITGVGTLAFGNLVNKIDLRNTSALKDSAKFIGTLDNHKYKTGETSAAFKLMVQDVVFSLPGQKSQPDLVDFLALDTNFIIEKSDLAIKELSLSCKFGSIHLQANQFITMAKSFNELKGTSSPSPTPPKSALTTLKTIIRVLKEVELKVTSAEVYNIPIGSFKYDESTTFATAVKDFSLDLSRLNSKNPAFRLFFSDDDIAHQAIVTGSSCMFGIDHQGVQEEIVYIPHVTIISKTNFFSKAIQSIKETVAERNDTILRANINITTPSVSMESHHIGILLSAFASPKRPKAPSMHETTSSFQKLWPRAVVKFTIDEPAGRVIVQKPKNFGTPIPHSKLALSAERGMVVLNCSKIYCDFESSHTDTDGDYNYNFSSSFQLSAFEAWYRSGLGQRYDFLNSESLSLQLVAVVNPSLAVSVTGHWNKVQLTTINSEVLYGLREVVYHLKKSRRAPSEPKQQPFALRRFPGWLKSLKFDINSVGFSIAADQLEHSFTASRGIKLSLAKLFVDYNSCKPKKHQTDTIASPQPTDNRHLSLEIEGFTGHKIVEPLKAQDQFLGIPNFTFTFFTDRDATGSLVKCSALLPTLTIDCDTNLYYIISICISLLRSTLLVSESHPKTKSPPSLDSFTLSFKSNLIKIKALLPEDGRFMIETNGLKVSTLRDQSPSVSSKYVRTYTSHPALPHSWTRLITARNLSVAFKDSLSNLSKASVQDLNEQILISTDGIRLNLAHRLVFYKLLDNLVASVKSATTLMHRALHGDPKYIISLKETKAMPNMPKIRIKASSFFVTIEDDLFESKLGLIFQVGLREQKKRLEKQVLFEAKVEAIMKKKAKEKFHNERFADAPSQSAPDLLQIPEDGASPKPDAKKKRANGSDSHCFMGSHKKDKAFHNPFDNESSRGHKRAKDSESYTLFEGFDLSEDASIGIDAARDRLHKFFSDNWIKEYNLAENNLKSSIRDQINNHFLNDDIQSEILSQERIVDYSPFPFLFFMHIAQVDWFLSKPSFTESGLRDFLFDIGKGQPRDTKYSVLVPLYNKVTCASLRMQLRDYPLPLLYFPSLHSSQKQDVPSITIEGNLVIAETLSFLESNLRQVFIPIDPLADSSSMDPLNNPFLLQINRTVASVKTFTDLEFGINTLQTSFITWCVSMQPAMQAFMQVFDLLSKPPIDPSEKLGFWDKIRSVFHARLTLRWPKSKVHFQLKGSQNPYELVEKGAGFVMCWKKNVVLRANGTTDPKELITVTSDEFVLAVPDYTFQEREYLARSIYKTGGLVTQTNLDESGNFQKVVMKLSGRVQWTGGLLFERESSDGSGRTFNFKPHYELALANPKYIDDLSTYDAYRGFRSEYLHLALGVTSVRPLHMSQEQYNQNSYNSIHLTPKLFSHFFRWFELFSNTMSLPVRAGSLFHVTDVAKPKKFGNHLYTVKYQIQLAPLFINHSYVHKTYANESVTHSCTGLKAKVDKFFVDMHQRRSPVASDLTKRWKMGLNVAEMDVIGSDLRVLLASFKEKSHKHNLAQRLGIPVSRGSMISIDNANSVLHEDEKIHDSETDFLWIDSDDYTELGETEPSRAAPKISIMPLSYTPRWSYFRQTDVREQEIEGIVPFGTEPSHECLIGRELADDTHNKLLKRRLEELEEQLKIKEDMYESLCEQVRVPDVAAAMYKTHEEVFMLNERIAQIIGLQEVNGDARDDVQVAMENSAQKIAKAMNRNSQTIDSDAASVHSETIGSDATDESLADIGGSSFMNRFIVHSVQIRWNNAIRNAILRYLHRVSERKSSSYFLTQRAVRYLDDLMQKQNSKSEDDASETLSSEFFGDIAHVLKASASRTNLSSPDIDAFNYGLHATDSEDYRAQDQHLVKLVSPQIQLISDQNPDYCVLLTSENIELKIVDINDKLREEDDGSKLVETRYGVTLQDAQFFVINQEHVKSGAFTLFSSNTYGSKEGAMWPPWLSIDCCYDSRPLKDALIIDRTSVSLRYDQPNSLRVQSAKKAGALKNECSASVIRNEEHSQNRIVVDFPKVVATCDSHQFFAMFTIVMDLLIYQEPMLKERSERLDKVLLATDFSNLNKAAPRVRQLQDTIRNFEELRAEFMIRLSELDSQAIEDLAKIEVEQAHAMLELFVMMEAIKSGMQKVSRDDDTAHLLKWAIGADQVIWHVLDEKRKPFLDLGLADASFNRVEGSDGFNSNSIEIGVMQGFNLVPESYYPEVFSPYIQAGQTGYDQAAGKFVAIRWTMLDPIGGIPIIQQFDIDVRPVKIQMESTTWEMLFDYIFPRDSEGHREAESPFTVRPFKPSASADGASMMSSESAESTSSSDYASSLAPSTAASEASTPAFIGKATRSMTDDSVTSRSTVTSKSTKSRDKSLTKRRGRSSSQDGANDDLSLMMKRASNYLSIVAIQIKSSILCISYKGEGSHNILDIHEFVLTLPDITYENKTWSNMDLVLQLKKDVTKILFQHTGKLVGNKFKRHHNKPGKGGRLELGQLTEYVAFMSVSDLAQQQQQQKETSGSTVGLGRIETLRGRAETLVPKVSSSIASIKKARKSSTSNSASASPVSLSTSTSSIGSSTAASASASASASGVKMVLGDSLSTVSVPSLNVTASTSASKGKEEGSSGSGGEKKRFLKRLLNRSDHE